MTRLIVDIALPLFIAAGIAVLAMVAGADAANAECWANSRSALAAHPHAPHVAYDVVDGKRCWRVGYPHEHEREVRHSDERPKPNHPSERRPRWASVPVGAAHPGLDAPQPVWKTADAGTATWLSRREMTPERPAFERLIRLLAGSP